jgi:uncharacterized repeat protein (TIGR03803 family)
MTALLRHTMKKYLMTPFYAFIVLATVSPAPAQTFTLLHVFHGADGGDPESAPLVLDGDGNLYSTTAFGGASGLGTVYKIDRKDIETVLHSFTGGPDGQDPIAGLVLGSDGNLYGTANGGGTNGFGTAFRVNPGGQFSVFYQFQGGTKASEPGRLLAGKNRLYGTAAGGAPFFAGMVFQLDRSGETDLYKFVGGADGAGPGALAKDANGNLYGVSGTGGNLTCNVPFGCGVIFKIDSSGMYSVLHVFVGPDGEFPQGLILDSEGNLYGTAASGGVQNSGTIFKLTPAGQLITLYTFTGGADGGEPHAGLVRDAVGNFYGTTFTGGIVNSQCFNFGCGVVFQLSPSGNTWKETVLHSFNGADGDNPLAPLILDPQGQALYGTTSRGGDYSCTTINGGTSCGTVFKISR